MPEKGSKIIQKEFGSPDDAKKYIADLKFPSRPTKAFVNNFLSNIVGGKPYLYRVNKRKLSWWFEDGKRDDRLGRVLLDRTYSTEVLVRKDIVEKNVILKTIAPENRIHRNPTFIGFTLESGEMAEKFGKAIGQIMKNL